MFLLTEIAPTVIFMINTRKKNETPSSFDYESKSEKLNVNKSILRLKSIIFLYFLLLEDYFNFIYLKISL